MQAESSFIFLNAIGWQYLRLGKERKDESYIVYNNINNESTFSILL